MERQTSAFDQDINMEIDVDTDMSYNRISI